MKIRKRKLYYESMYKVIEIVRYIILKEHLTIYFFNFVIEVY